VKQFWGYSRELWQPPNSFTCRASRQGSRNRSFGLALGRNPKSEEVRNPRSKNNLGVSVSAFMQSSEAAPQTNYRMKWS
jgi:hypothetical protein